MGKTMREKRVATVLIAAILLLCRSFTPVDALYSHFTIENVGSTATKLEIGCQPQSSKVSYPFRDINPEVAVVYAETTCSDQARGYFFKSPLDVENKLAVVQVSNCTTTWQAYRNAYYRMGRALQQASAIGMIIAEKYEGKFPEVIVLRDQYQRSLPPTCIITAENYERILGFLSDAEKSETTKNVVAKDFSFVFPYHAPYVRLLKNMDGAGALYFASTELPALVTWSSPSTTSSIEAELAQAVMTEDCLKEEYADCEKCWAKSASEVFVGSENLAGKVAYIHPRKHGMHCFYSHVDYTLLLQELGVVGVILQHDLNGLLEDQLQYSFGNVTIPTFTVSDNYGWVLHSHQDITEKMDLAGNVTNKVVRLPATTNHNAAVTLETQPTLDEVLRSGKSVEKLFLWEVDDRGRDQNFPPEVRDHFSCSTLQSYPSSPYTLSGLEPPLIKKGENSSGVRVAELQPTPECSSERECNQCSGGSSQFEPITDKELLESELALIFDESRFPCSLSRLGIIHSVDRMNLTNIRALLVQGSSTLFRSFEYGTRYPVLEIESSCTRRLGDLLKEEGAANPHSKVFLSKSIIDSSPLTRAEAVFNDALPYTGFIARDRLAKQLEDDDFQETAMIEVLSPMKPIDSGVSRMQAVAGRTGINPGNGTVVGQVVLVQSKVQCNTAHSGCRTCYKHDAFENAFAEIEGKIAFFPLNLLRTMSSPSATVLNGLCIMPRYSIAKLLQDRGAVAVIFGETGSDARSYEEVGWHEESTIPVYSVGFDLASEWYNLLILEKNLGSNDLPVFTAEDLIVRISESPKDFSEVHLDGRELSSDELIKMLPSLSEEWKWRSHYSVRATDELTLGEEDDSRSASGKWAYEMALWVVVSCACFGVILVSLLIRHYRARLNGGGFVRTIDIMGTRADGNPNIILDQGTYGWGPFRDRRRHR